MNRLEFVLYLFLFLIDPLIIQDRKLDKVELKRKPIDKSVILDVLTVYNPDTLQCDSTPFLTASLKVIHPEKLKAGKIRWMAVSPDLLRGFFHFGDTVYLESKDRHIRGLWVIQDTMSPRFKRRGDLLFDASIRNYGTWRNVKITKKYLKKV